MLNYIWLAMVLTAVLVGGLLGNLGGEDGVVEGAISMAKFAVVSLAIPLGAVMILWLGMMRLAEVSGIVRGLAWLIRPIMRRLFPEVPPEHPAMGAMVMNMAANMLGLGNAATPLGLRAMGHLQDLNPRKGTASNSMCTFLAINTSSVTLIPATAIALLAGAEIANPYSIVGPAIAATLCSTIAAIAAVKIFQRLPVFRGGGAGDDNGESTASADEKEGGEVELRRISGKGIAVLAVLGVLLAGIFMLELAPEMRVSLKETTGLAEVERAAAERQEAAAAIEKRAVEGSEEAFWRRGVNAVSVTAIPFLFVIFIGYAAVRGVKVYEEFVVGAKEGFGVALRVMPYMVAMLVALGMLRDSGALMLVQVMIAPVMDAVGFPPDLLPMALMRPLSGSGSQGVLGEILADGSIRDSIKYTAATMFGSTETTFYVLAVYFGAVGVRRTRHALAAGLVADAVGVIAAVAICKAYFG